MTKSKFKLPKSKVPAKTESWINYEDSIVIFIDILGFKDLIEKSYNEKRGTDRIIVAKIHDAIMTIRTILGIDEANYMGKIFISSFSDCIVITFPYRKPNALLDMLKKIQDLLINLNHMGIIVRGGITKGNVYANNEHQIVFGPGLVEAYLLESSAAHYPRVILDENIVKICKEYTKEYEADVIEDYLKQILTIDIDGMYYIDYFKPMFWDLTVIAYNYDEQLQKTRTIILKGLLKKNPGVKIKYMWMKKKFNGLLKKIQTERSLKDMDSDLNPNLSERIKNIKTI